MSAQTQQDLQILQPTGSRVLIIDDDASILGVVAEVLEDDGYDVTTAPSGEDGINLLSSGPFALVMSDIRLPGMNGVAVLQHVKAVSPGTNVIMITSHASLETSIDAIKHGAYDYLLKPFEDLSLISHAAKRAIGAFNSELERSQLIRSLKKSNDELARVNQILHGLAIRDGLTDLFNHRYINEFLDKQIAKAATEATDLSLIFADVDKFKAINDEHGHQNGDVILRELSSLIRESTRDHDVVARWGGEEFVIVCTNTDEDSATVVAESFRGAVAEHTFLKDLLPAPIQITISAGVASLSKQQSKPALIEAADKALYEAKDNGRNQVRTAGSP